MALKGVIPPMITSFDGSGNVDEKILRNLVGFLSENVHGLFVCGSYGSGPLMSTEQRKKVVEIAVDEAKGRVPVIVHVGATSTDTSVELAKHAESNGAICVASVPPYYYRPPEKDIINHYERLAKAVNIPVYVYNNPKTVGYGISPELMSKMVDVGIKGVKDSSFDMMVFADFRRKLGDQGFDVVLGTEALFLSASVLGARAFIPGLGNAFPEICVELYNTCIGKDLKKAWEVQKKVNRMREIMKMAGSTIVSVYEMLRMRGIDAGMPKSPFRLVDEVTRKSIQKELQKLEML
ncbi:MAG: dihydrodipicolinate synthase family protein [Candidatus Aerophobetes bacterium]|nr:dihydrodipicolinate synthase family protein [Candidatus Aerophobetes bacterium]